MSEGRLTDKALVDDGGETRKENFPTPRQLRTLFNYFAATLAAHLPVKGTALLLHSVATEIL